METSQLLENFKLASTNANVVSSGWFGLINEELLQTRYSWKCWSESGDGNGWKKNDDSTASFHIIWNSLLQDGGRRVGRPIDMWHRTVTPEWKLLGTAGMAEGYGNYIHVCSKSKVKFGVKWIVLSCCSSVDVDYHPGRSNPLTGFMPSLNF